MDTESASWERRTFIKRMSDGKLYLGDIDHYDPWTYDPYRAADISTYLYEKDAWNGFSSPDYELVEYELVAFPSGRTAKDLYRNGEVIGEDEEES